MNELRQYFDNNPGRLLFKWQHYFEIYERHFARFQGRPANILEVGVYHGGSLQMWKHYFGDLANIYGIDIDPRCKDFEEERIKVFIGNQADRSFLRQLRSQLPLVDILIDDGGHRPEQQITTFQELFPHITEDGVYLCEDLHTSYWKHYDGGLRRPGTFVEYTKQLVDELTAWHSRDPGYQVTEFTKTAHSMHFYDSVVVVEKRQMQAPVVSKTGQLSFLEDTPGVDTISRPRGWFDRIRALLRTV